VWLFAPKRWNYEVLLAMVHEASIALGWPQVLEWVFLFYLHLAAISFSRTHWHREKGGLRTCSEGVKGSSCCSPEFRVALFSSLLDLFRVKCREKSSQLQAIHGTEVR
jgi:hypothetical protein